MNKRTSMDRSRPDLVNNDICFANDRCYKCHTGEHTSAMHHGKGAISSLGLVWMTVSGASCSHEKGVCESISSGMSRLKL